jgi:hypothetical protein
VFGEGCKNFYSLCFFAELTREDSARFFSYRRIDYKVLEPGHSLLDTDRVLSGLDRDGVCCMHLCFLFAALTIFASSVGGVPHYDLMMCV